MVWCSDSWGASVQGVNEVAHAAEELGFDSVWTTDHMLVPKEHADVFGYVLEAVLTLGYVAALTRRVRLGTSIIVLAQRNAIQFAKEMATLDQYSGGRVIVGVGAGWMEGTPETWRTSAAVGFTDGVARCCGETSTRAPEA